VNATVDLAAGIAQLGAAAPPGAAIPALPAGAREKLDAFLALMTKWNRVYNLTAIREPERMVTHHVLDTLAALPALPSRAELRLLDVGSGGGVPGIPLAIARPGWHVVMLDSNQKKTAFVQQAVIELGLRNAESVTARVEDYAPAAPFDLVVSRAFADLRTFVTTSAQHLAPHGQWAAMKGAYPADEIAALPPTVRVVAAVALAVPGLDAERHLVVMEPVQ